MEIFTIRYYENFNYKWKDILYFFFFFFQVKVSKGIPSFRFSWYRAQFGSCRRRNHFSVSLYLAHSYSETVVIGVQCQCGICATRIGRPFLETLSATHTRHQDFHNQIVYIQYSRGKIFFFLPLSLFLFFCIFLLSQNN